MINFAYANKIQNAAAAANRDSRPSDKTVHLVEKTFKNLPPVFWLQNSKGHERLAPVTLTEIPATERHNLIQLAELFITEKMELTDITEIYSALAEIMPSERVLIAQYALSLTTDKMKGLEKAKVIRTIKDMSKVSRAIIINHAKFLITPSVNGDDVQDILNAVGELQESSRAPAERKNIVSLVNSLIKEDMAGAEILQIMDDIKHLPSEKRIFIVEQAHYIITEQMGQTAICWILNTLKALSEDQLLAKQASRLFTERMDPQTRIDVMIAIADVPPDDRESIIDLTIKLIPSNVIAIQYRVRAIQVLDSIPKETREEAVNLACASPDVIRRIALIKAQQED